MEGDIKFEGMQRFLSCTYPDEREVAAEVSLLCESGRLTGSSQRSRDSNRNSVLLPIRFFYSGQRPCHEGPEHAVADDGERVDVGESEQTPLLERPIDFGSHRKYKRQNRRTATFHMMNNLKCPEVKTEATQN